MLSRSEKTSPRGETNEVGQFVIDGISPGEYVLILVTQEELTWFWIKILKKCIW